MILLWVYAYEIYVNTNHFDFDQEKLFCSRTYHWLHGFSLAFQKDIKMHRDCVERWRRRTLILVLVNMCASCLAIDNYHR